MSDYNDMDMIMDNLWIGSLKAALDSEQLQRNSIKSILSVMRGKISIPKACFYTFISDIYSPPYVLIDLHTISDSIG